MNTTLSITLSATLLLLAGQAGAGMYRCGNTFSDKPCSGASGKELKTYASGDTAGEGQSLLERGSKVCADDLPKRFSFMDPDSVKIRAVAGGGKMEVIDYASQKITARAYQLMVNEKNEYGAYTGEKPYRCYTSEDGQRILQFRRGS